MEYRRPDSSGRGADSSGGVLPNSTENLQRWLKNPQEFKPGCKMPDFKLTDEQVQNVVAYLESFR